MPTFSQIYEVTKNSYLLISDDSKSLLNRDFCDEEIKKVTFQMEKLKALGPDGFQVGCFQKY